MKIQCNVCDAAEANVLCCADEAALCWACDEKVHAANKLASKHQRVPLSNSSSQMPKCDICQETVGYFFCLEDRALLCRKCDVAIHTVNSFVSGHRRFLLTGVKVGFETTEPVDFSTKEKTNYAEKSDKKVSGTVFKKGGTSLSSLSSESNHVLPYQATGVSGPLANKTSFSGGCGNGNFSDWHLDEFLGVADFNQNFGFMECGSSKADSGKLGDSDSSPNSRAAIENFDTDECLGEVPEISWIVPEMLSPPTASGLFWSKSYRSLPSNSAVFVPDVCSTAQSFYQYESNVSFPKRRRQS